MGLKYFNLVVIGQEFWKKLRSEILGVIWGIVSNHLLVLDLNIVLDNVVNSTGVDMQAHDIAVHATVKNCDGYGPQWLFP